MFAKITNNQVVKYPYTVGDLRRDNPNTSFPKKVPEATMAAFGMLPVTHADTPSYDPMTQRIEHSSQPVLQDGSWVIAKTVVALTTDEITAKNDREALEMRKERDSLLADTDWTQMNDSPLSNEDKTAWATYRQELRDISDLDAWPYLADEDWPVAP